MFHIMYNILIYIDHLTGTNPVLSIILLVHVLLLEAREKISLKDEEKQKIIFERTRYKM